MRFGWSLGEVVGSHWVRFGWSLGEVWVAAHGVSVSGHWVRVWVHRRKMLQLLPVSYAVL